ncbi:hypothetical protein CBS101457_002067 [Exobasidium rhododendri]|nr:hypothetical protein CBS101457_002067 [Exobasidium rhododendri]
MVLVVHHLNDSRSQRILWLLEELGVPYEIEKYQRGPDRRAPASLKKVNPLGKSPVITDGEVTLIESGAIVEYIIRKYGDGRGQSVGDEWINESLWSHFAEGSLMPTLVNKLIFSIVPTQAPFLIRPLAYAICNGVTTKLVNPDLEAKIKYVSSELDKKSGEFKWFAGGDKDGNPTAADYQMLFPLEAALSGRVDSLPANIKAWVEKVHERPAYQRALEKGGKYSYA